MILRALEAAKAGQAFQVSSLIGQALVESNFLRHVRIPSRQYNSSVLASAAMLPVDLILSLLDAKSLQELPATPNHVASTEGG
ncbi:hypothetical protein C8R42DRAFT_726243 [Lentinula raphanica]|nr:hypothetical protein C8R42DRAFT_726243 [Lentinula raphanica]